MAADPKGLAAAWLARLPAPERLAAHAHTDAETVAWASTLAILIGVCVLISRSGVLGRMARRIEGGGPRPWLASAVAAGGLTVVLATAKGLCDAAFGAWADALLSRGGGVAPAPGLAARLEAAAGGVLPATVAAVLLVPPLLVLMRRLPRTWPWLVGGGAVTLVLALGWLPYALSLGPPMTPAPPGPVRDGLVRLVAEAGVPAHEIWFQPDPAFDADVTGGFGAATVSVGPELLAAPPAETRAYVGHVMGHYAHGDVFIVCLLVGLVLAGGCFAAQGWTAPLARLTGARAVAGPPEPEAMPAAAIIAILAVVCAGLVGAAYLRWANVRADAYSLDHAREADGLAAVLEREWDHASVDPSPIEEAIFYSHPPLQARLVHAMTWKAAHGG